MPSKTTRRILYCRVVAALQGGQAFDRISSKFIKMLPEFKGVHYEEVLYCRS